MTAVSFRLARGGVPGVLLLALLALGGCSASFRTDYPEPVPAEVSQGWRFAEAEVTVPDALTVSEARTLLPRADIVWREDPEGDRKAQVAQIVADAVAEAASGLPGKTPVTIRVTITRFHALTFEAEARNWKAGVHDVEFTAEVLDAATGAVLKGPDAIQASLPAMAGEEMAAARARGETQKSQIRTHLVATLRGWLGIGPDVRGSFSRIGG